MGGAYCDWFNAIIGKRSKKNDHSPSPKQVEFLTHEQIQCDAKKLNGSKLSCFSIFALGRKARRHSMPIKDIAATRIQTAFRTYMARKALRRLKGTVRFQGLIEAHDVTKQVSATLDHIHVWSKIQAQIRARRICMVTEGRMRQKKLQNQLKADAKLHELEVEWCGGSETMEEILSRIQQKEEATVKRERAMAYAFSHQWRANTNRYFGQVYYDLGKESWGWSWRERWIAVCPWETRVVTQPVIPKNKKLVHPTRHGSKAAAAGKTTNMLVSVKKPHLGNAKGTKKATVQTESSLNDRSNSRNKD